MNWNTIAITLELSIFRFDRDRKPFSLRVILKCFILQAIYRLSDPQLEEEIADRCSSQIFLGLSSGDAIPDETTIYRYRELFAQLRQDKRLFKTFNQRLKDAGMILEKGTIIDASIKQTYTRGSGESRDKNANFLRRGKKTFFGYKAHIGIDSKSKITRSTDFTPANIHNSDMFNHLINGKETAILADKDYGNERRKSRLCREGIFCGVLNKSYWNCPLTNRQK